MKIKDGFIVNKVGTQYVVVPVGQASMERHCMSRLNETGAFLWKQLGARMQQKIRWFRPCLQNTRLRTIWRVPMLRRVWASCAMPIC